MKTIDHSLQDACLAEKPSEEVTKATRLDQTSQGRARLDWQEWSVQGPSLGDWSDEKPQAHPKEFNSPSTGHSAALHGPSRPEEDAP